ncbi:epoxide hydrolase family protein [Arthrobacter sp. NPDC090010]|uniref:epoxide hydrolase family protein n=1 Tax=Arthrobacter sp. NPDC090010 TaxID=3363942 RepID=UPI0037F6DA30
MNRPATNKVRDFQLDVPDSVLSDLKARLAHTRFAPRLGPGWSGGVDPDYLAEFVTCWRDEFDWKATERIVNSLPQKMVRVNGGDVHVIHVRNRGPKDTKPIPLVLTHGWPSSFFEFLPLIEPLTDPARNGGDPSDVFDVVIPSLPGYGYSDPLAPGSNEPSHIAALWVDVMDALGYERFGAYGGDVGSHVTNRLGADHGDRLIGLFTHHPYLHPVIGPDTPLSIAEQRYLEQRSVPDPDHDDGYAAVQTTRPNSLAAALSDSPAGLAGWILEKYHDWSDSELDSAIERSTLLNVVTLYWVTNTIGTSFGPYIDDHATPALAPVTVPAGLTLTPEDIGYPREFAARTYQDIRYWNGPEPGGHFLALENPERLVRELRDFYRPLR